MPSNASGRELIAAEVRAELARQRKTSTDVAVILGRSKATTDRRIAGRLSFSAEELMLLAAALDIPVGQFFPAAERAA